MWEHPDLSKRFTNDAGIPGFWRECIFCAKGSTDLREDPNYVAMTIVSPLPKKHRHLMKGQVYDKYWSICHDCFPMYRNLIGRKSA